MNSSLTNSEFRCFKGIHLGNVLNVLTDRKLQIETEEGSEILAYYSPDVVTQSDFYPFGMMMPNTNVDPETGEILEEYNDYRYSFQGQEMDNEVREVEGGSINYKYRMHDPRVGRFFAVDPLTYKYPFWSPYAFSGNQVIHAIEYEGLETTWNLNSPEGTVSVTGKVITVSEYNQIKDIGGIFMEATGGVGDNYSEGVINFTLKEVHDGPGGSEYVDYSPLLLSMSKDEVVQTCQVETVHNKLVKGVEAKDAEYSIVNDSETKKVKLSGGTYNINGNVGQNNGVTGNGGDVFKIMVDAIDKAVQAAETNAGFEEITGVTVMLDSHAESVGLDHYEQVLSDMTGLQISAVGGSADNHMSATVEFDKSVKTSDAVEGTPDTYEQTRTYESVSNSVPSIQVITD